MSGFYDKKIYDNCHSNMINKSNNNQLEYNLYNDYALNNNCCNMLYGSTKNLYNQDLKKLGVKSEIESLLQWRNYESSECNPKGMLENKNKILNDKNIEFDYSCGDCDKNLESISTNLDGRYNREMLFNNNVSRLYENKEVYNGISGTDQYNNNRFGVNTKLMTKDLYNKKNHKSLSLK